MEKTLVPVSAVVMFCALTASAADLTVSDEPKVDYAESVALTTATEPIAPGVASGIKAPVFWIDAATTNGWAVTNGVVYAVPSRVGNRFLTSDRTVGHFKGWAANDKPGADIIAPEKPRLVTDAEGLVPGVALDFGQRSASASTGRRALAFNAVAEGEGCSPSNLLVNIGTVIMVAKPNGSSAYFPLGGGFGNVKHTGDNWLHGNEATEMANGTDTPLTAPLLRSGDSAAPASAYNAILRHDGVPTTISTSGWKGGWEVMSFMPTNADLRATGFGVSRETGYGYGYAGGFSVAEMMIFDTLLTTPEVEEIEAYLQNKWFGRQPAGRGGNARIGWLHVAGKESKVGDISADVASGDTLTVDRLQGGRLGATLTKTGAGRLVLREVSRFGGDVAVESGTVAFPAKPVPTLAELPADAFAHFDASDLTTLDYDADTMKVSFWSNTTARTIGGEAFGLRQTDAGQRPTLVPDALGSGLNILNFGSINEGPNLFFSKASKQAVSTVTSVSTIIGFFGAQSSGGHLFGGSDSTDVTRYAWTRTTGYCSWSSGLLNPDNPIATATPEVLCPTNGATILLDGVKCARTDSYRHPGYQVLAITQPGGIARYFSKGSIGGGHTGGMRVGELFVFRRSLTEAELRDISAYLEKKWLGRVSPGYRDAAFPASRLERLVSTGTAVVDVPADATVRVGVFGGSGAFVKTGEGTVEAERIVSTGAISVNAGQLKVVAANDPGEALCQVAAGAALHFDACDTSRMEFCSNGGSDTCLSRWYSKVGSRYAYYYTSARAPVLKSVGGLNVVDFGETVTETGRHLTFDTSCDSVRSVFKVWKSTRPSPILLGSNMSLGEALAQTEPYDFLGGNGGQLLRGTSYISPVVDSVYTNGVPAKGSYIVGGAGFHLTELHLNKGLHASAIACDRRTSSAGGEEVGELIVYERSLTDREKVATRNYLMKKWFAKEDKDLTPLPAAVPVTNEIATLVIAAGAGVSLGGTTTIGELDAVVGAASARIAVDGTFVIPAGLKVNIVGDLPDGDVDIPLVAANAFEGTSRANLRSAEFTNVPEGRRKPKLVVENGVLLLRFKEIGLAVIVR